MSKWTIYTKEGVARRESITGHSGNGEVVKTDSLEYHGQYMTDRFLTVSVKSAYPIDFAPGDYIIYRGEKFAINVDANTLKRARRGTYGEGFVYDGIKFSWEGHGLSECDFNDFVIDDNRIHFSSLTAFSFFCSTVRDLADRIQANLDRIFDNEWTIQVHPNISSVSTETTDGAGNEIRRDISLSVSGLTCWDALQLVKEKFGTVFEISGKTVRIGYAPSVIDFTYQYGKRNGLYEIERSVDTEQKIITRLKGYGSSRNLPMRYYADIAMYAFGNVTGTPDIDIDTVAETAYGNITLDLGWDANLYKRRLDYDQGSRGSLPPDAYCVRVAVGTDIVNALVSEGDNGKTALHVNGSDDPDYNYNDDTYENAYDFLTNVSSGTEIRFVDGIFKSEFPDGNRNYGEPEAPLIPNNLAVQNLMLPGFPLISLDDWVEQNVGKMEGGSFVPATDHITGDNYDIIRAAVEDGYEFSDDKYEPYIISPNHGKFGVRESSVFFDGSADDQPEIFPTITGTGNDEVTAADTITDNGIYPEGTEVADFKIKITPGFSVTDVFQEGMTIAFNSGFCGGRSFEVSSVVRESNNVYRLNCHRSYDSSIDLWFPYQYKDSSGTAVSGAYQVAAGDKFVLLGIEMPAEYVEANAITLLAASIEYLRKYDHIRYTYQPKVDEIMMAYENDEASASSSSSSSDEPLYGQIREGSVMTFEDEDLSIQKSMTIESLTIRENGNASIPTYEVVLKEEETEGLLQELSKKVDYLAGTSGGNVSKSSKSTVVAESFWEEYTDPQTGNVSVKLKDKYVGVWTNGFMSALGMSAYGGGGGVTLNNVLESINNTTFPTATPSSAGQAIVWDGTKWTFGTAGGGTDLNAVWASLAAEDNTKQIDLSHLTTALTGYATQSWVQSQGYLTSLPSHNHDDRYYIQNGTIYLGGSSITPMTAPPTLYALSIYGGTTKVLEFNPYANASLYIKAGGEISLTNDTTNKYITLSYSHPTGGANKTISAADGKVLSAITVNSLGHVTSVASKTLSADDIPDLSGTYATESWVGQQISDMATHTWVGQNYLPLAGGTLTGDLRLKDSSNYGMHLYFGDGSYCYLHEDTDDHLVIHASKGVKFDLGTNYNATIGSDIIATQPWVSSNYPGTVTSVGMSVPTGFAISGSPITSSGTLALSFATGYSLPLTADVDKGVTANGWGNHAEAGYWKSGTGSHPTTLSGYGITDALGNGTTFWGQTASNGAVSGNMTSVGSIASNGEIKTSSANAFRLSYGTYGTILRNDSDYFRILLTASGSADSGSWNALRPFAITLSSGLVSMQNGLHIENANQGNATISGFNALRIGNGVIMWDSTNNAFKIVKYDGTSANIYATGGVSALGFTNPLSSLDAFTISYLTTTDINISGKANFGTANCYITANSSGAMTINASSGLTLGSSGITADPMGGLHASKFYLSSNIYLYYDNSEIKVNMNGTIYRLYKISST